MKQRAGARSRLLLAVLIGAACSPSSPRAAPVDASRDAGAALAAPVRASALREAPPLLRVTAREGEVTGIGIDDVPARDRLVKLAPDASLELSLADHARLSVRGPATLLLAPGGAPALLLRDGLLTVDCAAPVLPTDAPALWVATPSARLEVAQRARFVLRASPRSSVLSLASGGVRVRQNAAVHDLAEDATTCLSGRARWAHAPLRGKLEVRSKNIESLPPCARVVGEPSDALLSDELRDRLASLADAEARGHALLASHRALSQSDPRAAAAQQRAIAQHAAAAMRLSDEVRARRSVLAARVLEGASPALRELLARAEKAAP